MDNATYRRIPRSWDYVAFIRRMRPHAYNTWIFHERSGEARKNTTEKVPHYAQKLPRYMANNFTTSLYANGISITYQTIERLTWIMIKLLQTLRYFSNSFGGKSAVRLKRALVREISNIKNFCLELCIIR